MTGSAQRSSSVHATTRTVTAAGAEFVYRELGSDHGIPLVALTHLSANLDNWDPAVVDPLIQDRRVILLGYRGVGSSTGHVRDSIEEMATDAIAAIRALGLSRVDLFGLSMGGMVAQAIIQQAPQLVDRLVLAGSAPAGGTGLTEMTGITTRTILRGAITFTNPTTLLFFTRTALGKQAARDYQARLKLRRAGRDKSVTAGVFRAQLRAVNHWGKQVETAPVTFTGPVLSLHGDSDRMVPPANTDALAKRFASSEVHIYSDSGHGVVFQNHSAVTDAMRAFLTR